MGLSPTPCDGRSSPSTGIRTAGWARPANQPALLRRPHSLKRRPERRRPASREDASSTAAYKPPRLSNQAPTLTGSNCSSCLRSLTRPKAASAALRSPCGRIREGCEWRRVESSHAAVRGVRQRGELRGGRASLTCLPHRRSRGRSPWRRRLLPGLCPSGSSRKTETAAGRAGRVFELYDEPKLGARWLFPASAAFCL